MLRFGAISPICGTSYSRLLPLRMNIFCFSLHLFLQISGGKHDPWQAVLAVLPIALGTDAMGTFCQSYLPTPQL